MRCHAEPQVRIAGAGVPETVQKRAEGVEIVQKTALPGIGRRPAEAARQVKDRQVGEADPGLLAGGQNRLRELGRIGVGAAVGPVVQVVEFADRSVARLQHLDVELGGDRGQLVGADPLEEAVHDRPPGPERGFVRPLALGEAGHGALKGVAVHVRHARQDDAREPFRARRAGAGLDRGEVAAPIDLEPDAGGEALRQQGGLGPQHGHPGSRNGPDHPGVTHTELPGQPA